MKVAFFSAKPYDQVFFDQANLDAALELRYFDAQLSRHTAPLAYGCPAVCAFVNDELSAEVLEQLSDGGTRLIALRCAGFNQVDMTAANRLGLALVRVPAYSPHAVAEHALGLVLSLNRKLHRAFNRTREGDFSLDGLMGFDLFGKTVGVVGTGKIGAVFAKIMAGIGCRVLAFDPKPDPQCEAAGVEYVSLDALYAAARILSLHCPLSPETYHIIDATAIEKMTDEVMLINTSRGALVDTKAVITALKSGKIGALGLDVYEEEAALFFEDRSSSIIQDDVFARLLTFPNVLITSHQGFFTREAVSAIAKTTLANIKAYQAGERLLNQVIV